MADIQKAKLESKLLSNQISQLEEETELFKEITQSKLGLLLYSEVFLISKSMKLPKNGLKKLFPRTLGSM